MPGRARGYDRDVDEERRLRALYSAFNARDAETVVAQLDDEVDWPNAWEGGRLIGPDAVREYWARQWSEIDPSVEPTGFEELPDGRISVGVHQIVRDREGSVIAENEVRHVYQFRDGLVARMDVQD